MLQSTNTEDNTNEVVVISSIFFRKAISNPNRRINVISKEIKTSDGQLTQHGGILMRTTRSLASRLIEASTHTHTTKGKLKSFLNKEAKLHKNSAAVKMYGSTDGEWREENGKRYTNVQTYKFLSMFYGNFPKYAKKMKWSKKKMKEQYDRLVEEGKDVIVTGKRRTVTYFPS